MEWSADEGQIRSYHHTVQRRRFGNRLPSHVQQLRRLRCGIPKDQKQSYTDKSAYQNQSSNLKLFITNHCNVKRTDNAVTFLHGMAHNNFIEVYYVGKSK